MSQTTNAYYTITASSEFRERERLYEKARHDEAQALYHAKQIGKAEGKIEVAQKLIEIGMSPGQITEVTGLTHEEVESLKKN